MTKLCQQYLSEIKALFPVMGKPEKLYLAKLTETVEDYCIEKNAATLDEIYKDFGHPGEVVNTYLANADISYLIRRIRITKWIKRGILALLLIALLFVSIYGIKSYHAIKVFEQEQIYFDETEIY